MKGRIKKLTTKHEYNNALSDVNALMKKGEKNLTDKELTLIAKKANAIQEYENIHYPFPLPKTITKMVELRMSEKKINKVNLAKILGIDPPKLSKILSRKREPDLDFLKAIHEKLEIDGNFILERA